MNNYFKHILGQILQNEQPKIKEFIDMRFDSGYEFEGQTVYSFKSLRINEAIQFLEDNWEYLETFLR
jgi:hypothetical protein